MNISFDYSNNPEFKMCIDGEDVLTISNINENVEDLMFLYELASLFKLIYEKGLNNEPIVISQSEDDEISDYFESGQDIQN